MEKTTTLNLRVNPTVKRNAEDVLSKLGMTMSTAIDIYLNQIALTGGIPFSVSLPQAPKSVNADLMTKEELYAAIKHGLDDVSSENTRSFDEFVAEFWEKHKND